MRKCGTIMILIGIGLSAGFLNGFLGTGGGILIVAGLSALTRDAPAPRSVFASAMAVTLPLSVFSVWRYACRGNVPWQAALPWILPASAGGICGAWLLGKLQISTLLWLFGSVLCASGVMLLCR